MSDIIKEVVRIKLLTHSQAPDPTITELRGKKVANVEVTQLTEFESEEPAILRLRMTFDDGSYLDIDRSSQPLPGYAGRRVVYLACTARDGS